MQNMERFLKLFNKIGSRNRNGQTDVKTVHVYPTQSRNGINKWEYGGRKTFGQPSENWNESSRGKVRELVFISMVANLPCLIRF